MTNDPGILIRKKEELDWWNKYSPIMAIQWELTNSINNIIRKDFTNDFVRFLFKENGHILDVGCGNGWISRIFADMNMKCTAIDFSASQIELAKSLSTNSKHKNINYICHDVIGFNKMTTNLRFDSIMVNALLHHLSESEIAQVVRNLEGLLSDKGRIYFYEPFIFEGSFEKKICEKTILLISAALTVFYKINTRLRFTNKFYREYKKLGYKGKSPHERSFRAELIINTFTECIKISEIHPFHVFSLTYGTHLMSLQKFPQKLFSFFITPIYLIEKRLLKSCNWMSITNEKWILTALKVHKI